MQPYQSSRVTSTRRVYGSRGPEQLQNNEKRATIGANKNGFSRCNTPMDLHQNIQLQGNNGPGMQPKEQYLPISHASQYSNTPVPINITGASSSTASHSARRSQATADPNKGPNISGHLKDVASASNAQATAIPNKGLNIIGHPKAPASASNAKVTGDPNRGLNIIGHPKDAVGAFNAQASGGPNKGLNTINHPKEAAGASNTQTNGNQGMGLQRLNSPNTTGMGSPNQFGILPYVTRGDPDSYPLLDFLDALKKNDPALKSVPIGLDLTKLGLDMESSESLHTTFANPWANRPLKLDPEFPIPLCYNARQLPPLKKGYFSKFNLQTLFYIFYSMPKEEEQLYAANELHNRGWFYHKPHQMWGIPVPNMEPLVRTKTYERGYYMYFDHNSWDLIPREKFLVRYEDLENRPVLPQH